jgi:hypothetical protein
MEKPAEMAGFSGHYLVALTTTEWTAYVIDSTNTYNLVGRKIAPIVAPNSKKNRAWLSPRTRLDPSAQLQTLEVPFSCFDYLRSLGVRLTFFPTSSTDGFTGFSRTSSNSGATIQRRFRRRSNKA